MRIMLARKLYGLFLLVVVGIFLSLLKSGNWLETDLQTLLPIEQHQTIIQKQVDKKQEEQINRQIIILVGNKDEKIAQRISENIVSTLAKSHLFTPIKFKLQPNLAEIKENINQLKVVVLPKNIQNEILIKPKQYFSQWVQQIVNPFSSTNFLSFSQDFLGFGRFVLPQLQGNSPIQWDSKTGIFFVKEKQTYWVIIPLNLKEATFIQSDNNLSTTLTEIKKIAQLSNTKLLMTGNILFSNSAKQQAEKEMKLMSSFGIFLTLALLLFVFRTLRVLYLFVPIIIGLLCGITAVIIYFGKIHILTIVIGTSLVGVLIDFPLHWLVSSRFTSCWKPQQTMDKLKITFLVSLIITLIGYGLLAFTNLPILQQTALFSAMSLICAMLATLLYLPLLFKNYKVKKLNYAFSPPNFSLPKRIKQLFSISLVVFVGIGFYKTQWNDDIRQWVNLPKLLLQQGMQIQKLTKVDLSQQYFLIEAKSTVDLMKKDQEITNALLSQKSKGNISSFQSISEWFNTEDQQREFIKKLKHIPAEDYIEFTKIGIPIEYIKQYIDNLQKQSTVSLESALNSPLTQAKRRLYLGHITHNTIASIVLVSGVKNNKAMQEISQRFKGVSWQNKRQSLNETFQQTRNQAFELKILSFGIAALLLLIFFGLKKTLTILLIPFGAIIITIGVLGWLSIPISLFTLFGLLLVSAIGIDYSAYMFSAKETSKIKYFAITLAATTTLISFILLGLSATPAVASFGFSVSIGTIVSVCLTFFIHQEFKNGKI